MAETRKAITFRLPADQADTLELVAEVDGGKACPRLREMPLRATSRAVGPTTGSKNGWPCRRRAISGSSIA